MIELKRSINAMPQDVADRLAAAALQAAYDERPAYQRNDYLGWIARAKTVATRDKRIAQMLDELSRGGIYMKMSWRSDRTSRS